MPENQCGFRAGLSTVNVILSLRQMQEKAIEQRQPLYIPFINLMKVIDTIDRSVLWSILQ